MIYGYARCSTNETKQDIKRQERDLTSQGASVIYLEYEKGNNPDRPELNKLMATAAEGDTIIATELSRISRNVHQLCHILEWAEENKIVMKFGGFTIDYSSAIDPMTLGMVYMMGVFSQLEQGVTVQRIKSGLENAKSKGRFAGRKARTKDMIPDIFMEHLEEYKAGELTKTDYAKITGLSRQSIYNYLSLIE